MQAWMLASRPKTLTAAVVPIMVGTALAYALGVTIDWMIPICAFLSATFIQIGTNLVNDAQDYKKGADTDLRLGPVRVTQMGYFTARQVLGGGFACFALAALCAIPLVVLGGAPIATILIASLICGYLYTGGPAPLAYHGLGDLFVILFFGWIATGTTFYLQTGYVTMDAFVAGAQIGMLAVVMIAINNLRDCEEDAKVNKRTLAVRFGQRFAKIEIILMSLVPFVLNIYWASQGMLYAALIPLLVLPVAIGVCYQTWITPSGRIYNRYLGISAMVQLLFGVALTVGLCLS